MDFFREATKGSWLTFVATAANRQSEAEPGGKWVLKGGAGPRGGGIRPDPRKQ